MKTFSVGELKAHFSEVLEAVKKGQKIAIAYGKKKEKLAVIVPYKTYKQPERKLGILRDMGASYKMSKDFKMSDEEFLNS